MLILAMKKIIVTLMSALALFGSFQREKPADSWAGHDFPVIAAEGQKQGTVRVMSFNIRCADVNGVPVKDRLDIGVRQILEIMPDVLGIQEGTPEWMQELTKKLPMYDWVGVDRDNGSDPRKAGESCPVFYLRAKYRPVDSGNFWLSETPDEPSFGPGAACRRICTWVRLRDRVTGKEFVHVNTHLDHVSEEARREGARILTDYIRTHFEGLDVTFTADMNTVRGSDAYAVMTEMLADAQLEAADEASAPMTYHGWQPELHPDGVIDFILCPKTAMVTSFRTVTKGVDGRFTSDHFPIYADLRFKGDSGCASG